MEKATQARGAVAVKPWRWFTALALTALMVLGGGLTACNTETVIDDAEVDDVPLAAIAAGSTTGDTASVGFQGFADGFMVWGNEGTPGAHTAKTVYNSGHWVVTLRVDGADSTAAFASPFNGGAGCTKNGVEFIQKLELVNEGAYVKISYVVTNTDASPHVIGICYDADVQIKTNDSAPITPTDTGCVMQESASDATKAQFNVITKNSYGVTDADTLWFGPYGSRTSNRWGASTTSAQSGDTGLAMSWHDRTIQPGQTRTYSCLMGIGKTASAPVLNGDIAATVHDTTVDVSAQVKDVSGSVDKLYYVLDMDTPNESAPGVLSTVTANGSFVNMVGSIPRPASWQPGEVHTVSLWVMNQANAMSAIKTVAILVLESETGDVMKPAVPATVKYAANGGSGTAPANKSTYELATIELPNNTFTAPTGKKFAGWQAPDGTVYPAGANYALPENLNGTITMNAYWINTSESLYYVDVYEQQTDGKYKLIESTLNNGTVGQTATVTPPAKTGFTLNDSKSSTSAAITNAATPLHLALYYDRDMMNVTFASGVASIPDRTVQVYYDSTVAESDITALADQADATFGGWYTQPVGKGAHFEATRRIKADTTIYAYWVPTRSTMTFDYAYVNPADASLAGKTVAVPLTVVADAALPYGEGLDIAAGSFPANPANYKDANGETYQFMGWMLGSETVTDSTRFALNTTGPVLARWMRLNTLTISAEGSGSGTVAVTGATASSDSAVALVEDGQRATFSWQPDEGNRVAAVTVDGRDRDDLLIGGEIRNLLINENHTVRIWFEPIDNGPDTGTTDPGTDPTGPTDPTNPGTDPANPTDPTDPTGPTTPTTPGTEPADPANPTDPTNPGTEPTAPDADPTPALCNVAVEAKGGTVPGLTPSQWVTVGSDVQVMWDPEAVASVYVDGVRLVTALQDAGSYVFPSVTGNHTVTVYAKAPVRPQVGSAYYAVSTGINFGTITPSASKKAGESYPVTWRPAEGYHVVDVQVNGKSVTADGTWTFVGINAPQSLRVVCESDDAATDPAAPTNPMNPTNPTNPTDPTDPTDPADPTNPANPTDPTAPANPGPGSFAPNPGDYLVDAAIYGGPGTISPAIHVEESGAAQVEWNIEQGATEKYPHYKVSAVYVDGALASDDTLSDNSCSFDAVNADHFVEVYLEPNLVNVQVITSGSGKVSPSTKIFMGEPYDVWAKADPGWRLSAIYRDGEQIYPVGDTPLAAGIAALPLSNALALPLSARDFSEIEGEVTADTEYRVLFERESVEPDAPRLPKYTVRTSLDGGPGAISGSAVVEKGGSHVVTWEPGEGYRVSSVSVIRGGIERLVNTPGNSFTVSDVQSDMQVIVHLEPVRNAYSLTTAVVGGPGNITSSVDDLAPGTPMKVEWVPLHGSQVTMVEVDGVSRPDLVNAISLDLVMDANHRVTVYVDGTPEPFMEKSSENVTHPGDPAGKGDVVAYTVVAENRSKTALWLDVDVSDTLPAGLAFREGSVSVVDADGNELKDADVSFDAATATLTVKVGDLAPSERAIVRFEAEVTSLNKDELGNIAAVSGEQPTDGEDVDVRNEEPVLPGGRSDSDPDTPDDPAGAGMKEPDPEPQPGTPDTPQPGTPQPGTPQPSTPQPGTPQPGTPQPNTPQPNTPSINIDVDGDGIPDLNIDTNGDGIPDVNIDTNGDGIPDVNVDTDGTGKWKPSGQGGNADGIWKPDTKIDPNIKGNFGNDGGNANNGNNGNGGNGGKNLGSFGDDADSDSAFDTFISVARERLLKLAQTGDGLPLVTLVGVTVAALIALIVALVRRRRSDEDEA